jgi:formylglycine-generating enzyme required for sulfatase activity
MRLWSFNDTTGKIDLDATDYRKCFIVSPTEQLPAQFVTPQLAFYLARSAGCRLPTSREWLAALAQAQNATDTNMRGFATTGLRLRDRQFTRLLSNPNRDPNYWPDDNIFTGEPSDNVPHGGDAAIWSTVDLAKLTGSDAPPATQWPLSSLAASSGYGFRAVGDIDNCSGVFHDLIGNVAEFTQDAPVSLAEKVTASPNQPADTAVQSINDWFNPDHLKAVSIIGGSAVSPPSLDPNKPYPLPAEGPALFADVGFRLAFTDPRCLGNAQRAVIRQAAYLTAK